MKETRGHGVTKRATCRSEGSWRGSGRLCSTGAFVGVVASVGVAEDNGGHADADVDDGDDGSGAQGGINELCGVGVLVGRDGGGGPDIGDEGKDRRGGEKRFQAGTDNAIEENGNEEEGQGNGENGLVFRRCEDHELGGDTFFDPRVARGREDTNEDAGDSGSGQGGADGREPSAEGRAGPPGGRGTFDAGGGCGAGEPGEHEEVAQGNDGGPDEGIAGHEGIHAGSLEGLWPGEQEGVGASGTDGPDGQASRGGEESEVVGVRTTDKAGDGGDGQGEDNSGSENEERLVGEHDGDGSARLGGVYEHPAQQAEQGGDDDEEDRHANLKYESNHGS